jgi:hypothetical protein
MLEELIEWGKEERERERERERESMEGEQRPPSMWCNPNMVKMEVESNSSHGSDDVHGIHQTYFVNPSWPEPLLQALGNQGAETTSLLRILPHSIFDTLSSIIEVKQEQFEDATQEHHPEAEEEEEDMSSFKQVADGPLEDLGGKSGGKEEEDIVPPEDDPTERRSKTDVPQEVPIERPTDKEKEAGTPASPVKPLNFCFCNSHGKLIFCFL